MLKTILILGFSAVAISACTSNSGCSSTQYCYDDRSGASLGTCQSDEASGTSCSMMDKMDWTDDSDDMCAGALVCKSGTCTALTTNGGACAYSDDCSSKFCTSHVNESPSICTARVSSGGACTDVDGNTQYQCADGFYCSSIGGTQGSAGTCTTKKAQGGTCLYSPECSGLTGLCDAGKCTDPLGNFAAAAGGILGGMLAAIIIIPLVVCFCCCAGIYFIMKKKKGGDDD